MKTSHSDTGQNVHGIERAASIAGGLLFLGNGLRQGGLGGILQVLIGGVALTRGVTGRCEAKRVFAELLGAHEQPSSARPTRPLGMGRGYSPEPSPIGTGTDSALASELLPEVAPVHPQNDVNPGRASYQRDTPR